MCDNSTNPKEKFEGKDEVKLALEAIKAIDGKHKFNYFVDILVGKKTSKVNCPRNMFSIEIVINVNCSPLSKLSFLNIYTRSFS